MTAEVINAKQGLTRIPTYAELIKEIDREKIKTNDIRKIFDRNAWYYYLSSVLISDFVLESAECINNQFHSLILL